MKLKEAFQEAANPRDPPAKYAFECLSTAKSYLQEAAMTLEKLGGLEEVVKSLDKIGGDYGEIASLMRKLPK